MKLKIFVFDIILLPSISQFIFEVACNQELSFLDNAPGTKSDNLKMSHHILLSQQKQLEKAGARVEEGIEIEV